MWCANCHADVAAEVSADNKSIRCATCGTAIPASPAPLPETKTRDARDLLERWSKNEIFDPFIGGFEGESAGTAEPAARPDGNRSTNADARTAQPTFRVDASHPGGRAADPPGLKSQPGEMEASSSGRNRLDQPHESSLQGAHFDPMKAAGDEEMRKPNSASLIGQLLAYAGVGVLTIGTSLVLWGYFSGPATYAPTGWLIATAGQMLLFLGVVTLVSGGMEQTNDEVARRIERIGERMVRIEQVTRDHALKGPSIPAERFAEGGVPSTHKGQVVKHQAGDRR